MTKWNASMLALIVLAAVVFVVVTPSAQEARVSANGKRGCSVSTIAGKWMFATNIGEFPGDTHATALGTFNVGNDGSLSGTFDYDGTDGFYPGVTYTGSVSVNPDCTGTANFTTSAGASVAQSIAIVHDGQEIWGAFQDPLTIWTYKAARVNDRR